MIVESKSITETDLTCDVCIVGGGPAGIVLALELERHGIRCVLLESGLMRPSSTIQELSTADILDRAHHRPLDEAARRQLGGNSSVWGGRCVPLDPIDYETRAHLSLSGWPIGSEELTEYWQQACDYLMCGKADFSNSASVGGKFPSLIDGLRDDGTLQTSLERWSLPVDFAKEYGERLRASTKITVVLDATCTGIGFDDDPTDVTSVTFRSTRSPDRHRVVARNYIVAAGGLETTRLLLNSDGVHRGGIGNHNGKLGRYYMGHYEGTIADVQFNSSPDKASYDVDKDGAGVYCRKRISLSPTLQQREKLLNCVFWLDNLAIYDPQHRNGILSAAYLALSTPGLRRCLAPSGFYRAATNNTQYRDFTSHTANIVRSIPSTVTFIPPFLFRRYFAKRKVPRFYVRSGGNRYAIAYHAEQSPLLSSRVHLNEQTDTLGMRRLTIDLRFAPDDIDSIIRSHRILDAHLRKKRLGKLEFLSGDLEARILTEATRLQFGCHPIGTTRMSFDPDDGVVDANCRVHGIRNLYVVSSSVFATSGHANPTLTIVTLAVRLADRLGRAAVKGQTKTPVASLP